MITVEARALLQERHCGRTGARRSSQWGTRCCSTRSRRSFRRGRCSRRAGWAPSRSSPAPRIIPTALNCRRTGAPLTNSTLSACGLTAAGQPRAAGPQPDEGIAAGRRPMVQELLKPGQDAIYSCAGRAATRRVIRGSRSTVRRTVWRPSPPSSGPPATQASAAAAVLPRPATQPPAAAAAPQTPAAVHSAAMDSAPPDNLGDALGVRTLLCSWQDDGWQRCTVARLCPRARFFACRVVYAADVDAARHGGLAAGRGIRVLRQSVGAFVPGCWPRSA